MLIASLEESDKSWGWAAGSRIPSRLAFRYPTLAMLLSHLTSLVLNRLRIVPLFTNQAGGGGAVFSLQSQFLAITGGSSFANNTARASNGNGGAVAVSVLVRNFTIDGASFDGNACQGPLALRGMYGGAVRWLNCHHGGRQGGRDHG